jgi:hypothetical protein
MCGVVSPCHIEHQFGNVRDVPSDDPDLIEERRRKALEIAAQQSKAATESYRRPFGADPSSADNGRDGGTAGLMSEDQQPPTDAADLARCHYCSAQMEPVYSEARSWQAEGPTRRWISGARCPNGCC